MKKRLTLELNSHSLSHFQQCEQRYYFSERMLLTSKEDYYPFKRGAGIAKYLSIWYLAKKKHYSQDKLTKLENFLMKKMAQTSSFINSKYEQDDRVHIMSRIMGYFNKYRTENYSVIAVETGFSKVLYEDSTALFVYSGRPDLVLDYGQFGIGPMDHKSESRANDILEFNNQFAGYAWALNARVGIINYIGLQKDFKDGDVYRRKTFNFTAAQIDKWKNDTISWYHRILYSIVNKKFLRSWNCDGKYGACLYYPVCKSGSKNEEVIQIKRNYRKLEKPYRSW